MKACTKCGVCKPLDQFRTRKTGKPFSHCKACDNVRAAEWQARNRHRNKIAAGKYLANNKEQVRERSRQLYHAKKLAGIPVVVWTDELRKRAAEYSAKWRRENPGKCRALESNRKAAKLQRTPPWADLQAIEAVYEEAAFMRSIGVDAHVDHIVPLRGNLVSGLHVHTNLQILLATDNQQKSNKFTAPS